MASKARIGVYVCHCGINIAHTVDVEAVARYAGGLPGVAVARDYTYMCSDPGQGLIKDDIAELGLTGVVVAACSPLMHEPTFRNAAQEAGANPYRVEIANVREQCSWVHLAGETTTQKAMQLVSSAVSKARQLEELFERESEVEPAALVVGAGIAGMQAALDIADAGFQVYLVEQAAEIGGRAAQLSHTFPTMEPVRELLSPIAARVLEHPLIELLTESRVREVGGYYGNFEIEIERGDPSADSGRSNTASVKVGAIVVATGYDVFDPRHKPEFGYGDYDGVMTSVEFERLLSPDGPTGGELLVNGKKPEEVVFVQCVGSRDKQVGNPYCSRVCCMYTAKQANLVVEKLPDANVTVLYMDIRAFGKGFEEFYDEVREKGVFYVRANPSEIVRDPGGEALIVQAEDTLLRRPIQVPADLVVLALGMEPRQSTSDVAALLRLSNSSDGFLAEAHPKLRPVDTAVAGVFLAGCCQGPKDIPDSISQARAAAAAALVPLMRGRVSIEAATAYIDPEVCAGCGVCEPHCTYGALSMHPFKGVMTVNAVLCQGCGACAAACPSGASDLHHFTLEQTLAQIDALLAPVLQDFGEASAELSRGPGRTTQDKAVALEPAGV
ncbi:MAG: CoB--CoM heterodisulfide reductase iron-sulfur subunit A family protein [Anaerolineae bacterium]|jgi:heterodisulfide reductase subunit A